MIRLVLALSVTFLTTAAWAEPTWQRVGATERVESNPVGGFRLNAEKPVTAGQLSSPIALPPGCDAVMVSAELSDADAHTVTFAVSDAASGAPIGYWLNPVRVASGTRESAVLDLAQPARAVRIFVGADGRATGASIADVKITPLRRVNDYRSVQYGAVVSPAKTAGQTFQAVSPRFGGVSIHLRCPEPGGATPSDLTARLYAWRGDPATTRAGEALASTTVPGHLIPAGPGSIERDLMIPLDAPLEAGQRYYIELSGGSGGAATADAFHLLFAGPDALPDGQHFVGDNATDWDLRHSTYVREW